MPRPADIAANLQALRRRIDAAAQRARRTSADITLVAVSKTVSAEVIRAAADAGQRAFGENRVQEAVAKIDALADLDLEWHLIGHLQTNKAKKAASLFRWIESVDSLDLLRRLEAAAAGAARRPAILVQVDLAGEVTKYGAPEDAVRDVITSACASTTLDMRGLMVVPPIPENPEDSRPWFRRLRDLRDQLVAEGIPAAALGQLSMGMSHDFEVAIEEGATIVRVGTALFGERPPAAG